MGSCISCLKKKNNEEYTIFNDSFSTSSTDTTIDRNIKFNKPFYDEKPTNKKFTK